MKSRVIEKRIQSLDIMNLYHVDSFSPPNLFRSHTIFAGSLSEIITVSSSRSTNCCGGYETSHFLLNSLLQSFKLSIPLLLACLLNPHRVHTQLICYFFSQCITAIIWRILGLSHHYWFLTLFIWIVEFIIELFHCCIRSLQISQNLDHSPSRWVYDSSTWDSAESTRSIVAWCESIWENCFCLWMYDGPVYISSSIPALWFYKTKSDM